MQTHRSTAGRTRILTRATSWQFPTLIAATLLLGLFAGIASDPYRGNPALVDGAGVIAGP
jgi:hypothetical protein